MGISKDNLVGFNSRITLFSEISNSDTKCIEMFVDPLDKYIWFEYRKNGTLFYAGSDLDLAIEKYNK